MNTDLDIDAIGLLCPLPVLRLRKRMAALAPGQVACLRADDPAAIVDVPHFCNESGNAFLEMVEAEGHMAFYVRKG